jgi:hypothetical protein
MLSSAVTSFARAQSDLRRRPPGAPSQYSRCLSSAALMRAASSVTAAVKWRQREGRCSNRRLRRYHRRSPSSLAGVRRTDLSYRGMSSMRSEDRRQNRRVANPIRPSPTARLRPVDCWRCRGPRMRRYFCCARRDRMRRVHESGRGLRTAKSKPTVPMKAAPVS